MESQSTPQVVQAERLKGDLFIVFSDGRSALYPASLLYQVIAQAEVPPADPNEDP